MTSAYHSSNRSSPISSSPLTLEPLNIDRQDTCSCFVCDGIANGGDSVRLQYGRTAHSNTDLPMKLGQLIGDDFMVIVSVNDRLCLACIHLIDLADKLEVELDTVKKTITRHLKTKYQLLDENDYDLTKLSCDLKCNDDCESIQGEEQNLNFESSDPGSTDKVGNLCAGDVCPDLESNIEIVQNCETESEQESISDRQELLQKDANKQPATTNNNLFVVREMKKDGIVDQIIESNVVNLNKSQETDSVFSKTEDCGNETKVEISCNNHNSERKLNNEYKSSRNRCRSSNRPMFKCTMCEDEFQTQVVLRKHIMSKHLTKWSCYFCSATLSSDREYEKHMQTHIRTQQASDNKSSVKIVEDSGGNTTTVLQKQNEIRTFFKCKNCKFRTRFNYLLDKHENECRSNSTENCIADTKCGSRSHKCPTCSTSFKTQRLLNQHACNCTLTISKNVTNTNEKPFKFECGLCSETFSVKSSLIAHLKSHKIDNSNDLKSSRSKDNAEIIQVDVDLGTNENEALNESNTISSICDQTSMQSTHCSQCSLTFDKHLAFTEHVDRVHSKKDGDDNEMMNTTDVNTPLNEIYFGNVEHFMALTTSGVEIEQPSMVHITSNNTVSKENATSLTFVSNKADNVAANEFVEENKTGIISINDLVNTATNFSCDKCNVLFNSKDDYSRHSITCDHKNVPYPNFIKVDNFDTHNNNSKTFENDQYFDDKTALKPSNVNKVIFESLRPVQNLETSDMSSNDTAGRYVGLSCQNCMFVASTFDELKLHEDIDHGVQNTGEMAVCSICNKYINKDDINNHYRSNHKNIYCRYCSFETKNKRLMRQHIKEHNGKTNGRKDKQQGYLCQFCSETFKTKKLLQLHEELHPENFEFNCDKCNKRFTKERQLKRHHDEAHRDPHCYYCGKEILNLKALKSHEQRHMRDLHSSKQLECDICKRVFKTRTGLRHHFAIHTGKFKYFCDFCQRGFMSKMMLEEHRSCHTKEDRYICDVCGRKFTFQSTYWIHRKWHDNPFPYKCNFCGRLFRHTSLLAVHKRKHTGERPYKCPHCPLSFTVGGTLKRHLILHTQKYPFSCETCKRGFTTKHKYSMHLARMHNNYELLNDKKSMSKETDFKMVVKEKLANTDNCSSITENEKLPIYAREQVDNFEFMPDSNFALVNMEEDDAGNSAVMMPCIMTVNNEENSSLVFEIISAGSPLPNGMSMPEPAILPDMWCE